MKCNFRKKKPFITNQAFNFPKVSFGSTYYPQSHFEVQARFLE